MYMHHLHYRAGDVLVVDDDPMITEMIAAMLSEAGYAVRTVFSGAEALSAIEECPPAVVLLDMMMPMMNGGELITQLHAHGATFPIAIITASPALAVPFLSNTVVCIEKPFDIDVLLAWVGQYVQSRRYTREQNVRNLRIVPFGSA